MKKTLIILITALTLLLSPFHSFTYVYAEKSDETAKTEQTDSPDPAQILTDPSFDLNTVDPIVLDEWYGSAVMIPDANLKKALKSAANVSSGDEITVEDMLSLPTTLNLSGLSIITLSGMEYAINVKELTVSNNSITNLEPLKHLYNLEYLNYANNSVNVIPGWLFTSRKLTEINGSVNGSRMITSITGKSVIETLYLEGNELDELPDMSYCSELKVLSLSNNLFETVPDTISSLKKLESLSFSNNQIQYAQVSELTNLQILDISNNKLTEVPVGVEQLTVLEQLKLEFNQISLIPENLTTMTNLQYLGLTFNDISSIPESITNMTSLKVLAISVNYINLTEQESLLQTIETQVDSFSYKLQKPNFVLTLVKDRNAPGGKLVWDGINEITDETEGYITITKFVIERKEETIMTEDESGSDEDNTQEDGAVPVITFYEEIAEVEPDIREYIDETADPEKNYTYRVTAYITGMYMGNDVIDTTGSETVNTADMIGPEYNTDEIVQYIAVGVVALAVIVGLSIALVKKNKNKKRSAGKRKASAASANNVGNVKKKKKRKKIKITTNQSTKADDSVMIDEIFHEINDEIEMDHQDKE